MKAQAFSWLTVSMIQFFSLVMVVRHSFEFSDLQERRQRQEVSE
jgi:hypothetical protein